MLALILNLILVSYAAENPSANKNQIETFYIWKLSDELALDVHQEQKFAEITRSLNTQKNDLANQMQQSLEKMKSLKDNTAIGKELNNYRSIQKKYLNIADVEVQRVLNLLGPVKTAQYLIEKQNLTNKLKSVLANPKAQPEKPAKLPPPKIIQEK